MRDALSYLSDRAMVCKALPPKAFVLVALVVLPGLVWVLPGCESDNTDAPEAVEPVREIVGEADPAPDRKKVLLVHSYHKGYPWVDGITRGLRMALSGSSVDLQVFCMDTKRNTSEAWKVKAGRTARQIVAEWEPDVVIAADDNAQRYFVTGYVGTTHGPQFVFCGVNADPAEYGYPAPNVTGILERAHFEASFDMLAEIVPKLKRIAFITDNSPTSKGVIAYLKSLDLDYEIVSISAPDTFAGWKEAVQRQTRMADALAVYNYHTIEDDRDRSRRMSPSEVMKWTADHCDIPIIGFLVFTVDDGALCGYLESSVEHGMKAGSMALEILGGVPAGEIPLVTALEGQSMLNLITARRLGIDVPDQLIAQCDVTIGE